MNNLPGSREIVDIERKCQYIVHELLLGPSQCVCVSILGIYQIQEEIIHRHDLPCPHAVLCCPTSGDMLSAHVNTTAL